MDQNNEIPNEGGAINNENDEFIGKHKFLKKKDARNAALLRMGHEGVMMEKMMRQNKIVENTVKGLQEQAGYPTSAADPNSPSEEDDMGVNIGNETKTENHYHYQQPAQPQPEHQTSKQSNLVPAAILAAGALTGAGLYFSKPDPAPPSQVIVEPSKPNDYDIGVGFDEPEPINIPDLVPLKKNGEKQK